MKLLPLICAVCINSVAHCSIWAAVHKFEDGFIERSMAVVVRDKTAHVEYSIGLNEVTLRSLLENWEKSTTIEGEQASPVEPGMPVGPTTGQSQETPDPSKKDTETSQQGVSQEDSSEGSTGGHAISPELLSRFKKVAPAMIGRGTKISCNGETIAVQSVEIGPPPRHPFTFTVIYEFQLPDAKTCNVVVQDNNFENQKGAVRYALKATGDAMLLQSNVAPILVRADRILLDENPDAEPGSASSINVRLGFATKPGK